MGPDIWFHSGELLTLIVAGARVVRAANRVLDVMRDFPPHRHVNGHVIYPEGYPPAPIEELGAPRSRVGSDR
jgi:hypothetical protein